MPLAARVLLRAVGPLDSSRARLRLASLVGSAAWTTAWLPLTTNDIIMMAAVAWTAAP